MPDQGDIFTTETQPTQNPTPQGGNQVEDLLASMKHEDGSLKYKSVEDALKAMPHAQSHVAQLEAENAQLKASSSQTQEQLSKIQSIEATLEKLAQSRSDNQSGSGVDEQTLAALVAELVDKDLTSKKSKETISANMNQVTSGLKERFGEGAKEAYQAKAKELNMTVEELNALGAKSPNAVMAFFGKGTAGAPSKSSAGSVNPEGYQQSQPTFGRNPMYVGSSTKDLLAFWNDSLPQ